SISALPSPSKTKRISFARSCAWRRTDAPGSSTCTPAEMRSFGELYGLTFTVTYPVEGFGCQYDSPSCAPTKSATPFSLISVPLHEIAHDVLIALPRAVDEVVVAHRKRRANEELLVGHGAARPFGADEIPRQLEELQPIQRAFLRRRPVLVEDALKLRVVQHAHARRHLEHAAAHQLADLVAE